MDRKGSVPALLRCASLTLCVSLVRAISLEVAVRGFFHMRRSSLCYTFLAALLPLALAPAAPQARSEEHTSELQSLLCTSYAVFCLKNKQQQTPTPSTQSPHLHHSYAHTHQHTPLPS